MPTPNSVECDASDVDDGAGEWLAHSSWPALAFSRNAKTLNCAYGQIRACGYDVWDTPAILDILIIYAYTN